MEGKMMTLVIYHAGCYDGFTAAWVANSVLKYEPEGCELFPATFGDAPPDVTGRDVYVLDFSYPRQTMIEMAAKAASFQVFDHHQTAQVDCEGLEFCTFDMERSGAGMAWDHFQDPTDRHWLIDAVEDRDLWRFRHEGSKAVHAYISSKPMNLACWTEIANNALEDVVTWGGSILGVQRQYIEKVAESGVRMVVMFGRSVVVCNAPYVNCSELAHYLLEMNRAAELSCTYYQNADRYWVYSLRSRSEDDVDVSAIAKVFGGGGHKHAAGFPLDEMHPALV